MYEWINKMWSIYTMEYDSALRRNKTVTPATTWMKLEDIMLSEISQTPKDNLLCKSTYMTSLE